ncbi:hypothetical protein PIIN_09645 [Serendipita indica DSM 11827]|uniref:Uncharacterized protein n=1 Tax=Serendipita indica (strain DSM 11827) TaxID=1109443 RepID=G4TWG2_SERID|nr:hypothetical protein PIIN_09645 [Serendipita indica DSM 11827]
MPPTNQPIKAVSGPKIAIENSPGLNKAGHGDQMNTVRTSAATGIETAAADDNVLETPAPTLDTVVTRNEFVEVAWTKSGEFTGLVNMPWPDWLTTPTSALPDGTATSLDLMPMEAQQVTISDIEGLTDEGSASQDSPNKETLTEYIGATWDDSSGIFTGHVHFAWPFDDATAELHLGHDLNH